MCSIYAIHATVAALAGIADPICERAESIDGVCESTIVDLTRVAGLRAVVDAVAHSVAVIVCLPARIRTERCPDPR